MRRRSGNSLAWQSVLTEQDQTRFLRFRNVVEVWEFDVGLTRTSDASQLRALRVLLQTAGSC